jgi:hypothetical protein
MTAGKTARRVGTPGGSPKGCDPMEKITLAGSTKAKPLNHAQREALRRRRLKPGDYVLVKETYTSWYFRNINTGLIKVVGRCVRVR